MKRKILLVKGGLDGHDRGILVIARALRDAGEEVIYGGLYRDPEEIASMAIQEDPDLIGISMHSGAHIEIFSDVLDILKKKTKKDWILFGGGIIPQKDIPALHELGVKKIFLPGTDTKKVVDFVKEVRPVKEAGMPMEELVLRARCGDTLAASRLMTLVTRGNKEAKRVLAGPIVLGVTGPGGVGKSTLIGKLIRAFRAEGKTVGVVVCDPISVSGGSFLGDRIRMGEFFNDGGVFIRSLSQYENYKGVTPETPELIKIFELMKKDVVIVETVGVGQGDLGFKELVKTLVFVTRPRLGDEIQVMKGGAIETADIIVVNQSDQPGADETQDILSREFGTEKKIFRTNAITGEGIAELIAGIKESHG